jgi:hypothetical protein
MRAGKPPVPEQIYRLGILVSTPQFNQVKTNVLYF